MIYKKKCELRLSFPNGRPSTARTIVKKNSSHFWVYMFII